MRNFLVVLTLLLFAATADAIPPRTLSYQGVLTDATGIVVPDGTYSMTFRIYGVPDGGLVLWTEIQNVTTTSGRFDVILGSSVSLITLDFDFPYYLTLQVDSDPEMTPRTALAGAPYSQIARTVEDNAITSTKIANNTVLRSLNGLEDNVNILAGTNVTLTPIGNDIEISTGGNAPGIASQQGVTSGVLTGPGTINVLASRIITCPAAGYVLAIASAHAFINHTSGNPTWIRVGTSDVSTAFASNQEIVTQIPFATASGLYTIPTTSHRVYAVSAGPNTFHVVGEKGSSNGTASIAELQLSLVYLDNAYGSVSPSAVANPSQSSIPFPAGDSGIPSRVSVGGQDALTRELADLRARMASLEARLRDE